MKQYRIHLDSTAFKSYLDNRGVKWEIVADYVGLIVHLECDSDLFDLAMQYERTRAERIAAIN